MPEKYHVMVMLGYFFVVAVIISVLKAPIAEKLGLWLVGAIFFSGVLRLIRKGIDPPKHFD